MRIILLSPYDLAAAAALVLILAIISLPLRLNLFKQIVIAALRTIVQLLLVGIVLKAVFESVSLLWIGAMGLVMLSVAARETTRRQKRRLAGGWAFYIGGFSMLVGSFSVTILALTVILNVKPWYQPQYAIPLLGMMLGNTMTGVALGLDRLTQESWQQREEIEACLMLGYSWDRAIADIRRDSIRAGLIPIINSMSVVGLVSLPGMMTGQILAGSPPLEAVKYQILIMFLIAASIGFGTICAVWAGSRRLFDERQRLRLDRLKKAG